ncbi:MAG: lipoprotein insertase outer membrane protein LolB [Enterobacterales bacterium]|nr:lipoprotein insertase outer membrane protein LolB [Enterobacterales bacterium]
MVKPFNFSSWLPRLWLMCGLLLFASGCIQRSSDKFSAFSDQPPLATREQWLLKARIAIKTPKDSLTASLKWQNNQANFDFHLSGAFGTTYAHLVQTDDFASLKIPDHAEQKANNAERLLSQNLGWHFPIKALSFWVKGLVSGQTGEQVTRNPEGQITHIQLNQWSIEFKKYKHFQGYLLPKMIIATHPDIRIKLVAKKWRFLES